MTYKYMQPLLIKDFMLNDSRHDITVHYLRTRYKNGKVHKIIVKFGNLELNIDAERLIVIE